MATKKIKNFPGATGGAGFQTPAPSSFGGDQLNFTPEQNRQREISTFGRSSIPGPNTPQDGATNPNDIPQLPPTEGTFTSSETGRPSGLSVGGRNFFVTGSDLELLKQQQDAKRSELSGSQPLGSLKDAIAQRDVQVSSFRNQAPREQLQQGAFAPTGQAPIITNIFPQASTTKLLTKIKNGKGTPEEIASLGLTPLDLETLRTGKANVNKISQFIEGLPVVGGRAKIGLGFSISLSDLVGDSPSKQIELLLKQFEELDGSLETDFLLAQENPLLLNDYISNVKNAEQKAIDLQSRLKLLFLQSPQMQANPDNVDKIMAQIDDNLDKIELRKLRAGII